MKILSLCIYASCFLLHAQEQPMSYWDFHPLHAGGQIVRVGKAECEDNHRGNVHFRKSNSFMTMLVPFDAKNYIFPRVEFNYVTFEWNKNPKFREIHFYYLQFGLMFYSKALDNWRWIVRFDYNIQTEHLAHPRQYSLYTGMIWGTYQIHRKWHYHVGALGYGGLEGGTVYPIIGFDYTANKEWFFQAIFPMIYSVEYRFRPQWTLAFKGRPLKERLRTGSREPQPRSIFNYSSFGAELNLNYNYQERLIMEIYGGYDFFGNFYIKNAGGHNGLYVDLNKAPYVGASLDFGF